MKKLYIEPKIGKGSMMFAQSLLTTSVLQKGDDVSGTSGSHVEADARGGFWDETE